MMTSEPTKTVEVAVPMADADRNDELAAQSESLKQECLQMSTGCSMVIGMIVGCFIQCSTMGSNFLMTTMYGREVFLTSTFIYVSLAWCFVTSIMGVSVLLFLRSLVVTSFYATNSTLDAKTLEAKENFMVQVIDNIEQFFAVGSLVGVGLAWTVTDMLLGMQTHIYHSILTVVVALIWCKFAMSRTGVTELSQPESEETSDDLKKPLIEA